MIKYIIRAFGYFLLAVTILVIILLFKPVRPTVDPIQPRPSTEYWAMKGGYRIALTKLPGPSSTDQPPIIYLHGGPGGYIHSSLFDTLSPLTQLGHDIYLYDQSGSGLSDRRNRPKDTTFQSHIDDLREIITEKLSTDQVVLIGHSFGGQLAAHYAALYPDSLAGLVLSAPAGIQPPQFDEAGEWINATRYPVPDDLVFIDVAQTYRQDTSMRRLPLRILASMVLAQLANRRFAPDKEADAALNRMAAGFTRNMVCNPENVQPEEGGGGAYARTGTNFFPDGFDPQREAMTRMSAPVLVLHGQCDFIPYASVYEYVDLFPRSSYQFVEDAGHIIWWDQPDAYREAIADFLRRDVAEKIRVPVSPETRQ